MAYRRLSWILAALLALVYAQGVAAAHHHGTDKAKTEPICQICLHGQHVKGGLPVSLVHAVLGQHLEVFITVPSAPNVSVRPAFHPARGPPA